VQAYANSRPGDRAIAPRSPGPIHPSGQIVRSRRRSGKQLDIGAATRLSSNAVSSTLAAAARQPCFDLHRPNRLAASAICDQLPLGCVGAT
jgi:hypothetical protein